MFDHFTDEDHAIFMRAAQDACANSHDPKTQTGAVIVTPDREIIGRGSNTLPSGRLTQEIKDNLCSNNFSNEFRYNMMMHAEPNSIFDALMNGRKTEGCAIYLPWYPCIDCAKNIARAGLKMMVHSTMHIDYDDPQWGAGFRQAKGHFDRAGMRIVVFLPDGKEYKREEHMFGSIHYADFYKSEEFLKNHPQKTR